MVAEKTNRRSWARAIEQPAREFDLTPLTVLAGAIPPGLSGSLYRNGPGRLERNGMRVGHWFDGDGAILAVHFAGGQARATYRYVQTTGYLEEERAGRFLYGNYGMTPPGQIWERWGKTLKNAANTSVLAVGEKLLALWEGGNPHALDLETLKTMGLDNLERLEPQASYSAHPKRDPDSGEIYNFGVSFGLNAVLNLYRSDATGRVLQTGSVELEGFPLVHDFVLAGRYLIFFVPAVRLNPLPLALGLESFSEAMHWHPEKGTGIYVIDRETLTLKSRSDAPSWFQWHFGNGFEREDGTIVVHFCRYDNFDTNQFLREVASGETNTPAIATYWQVCLDPNTGRVRSLEAQLDRACEFPVVAPAAVGRQERYTYLALHRADAVIGRDYLGAIGRFDSETGQLTEAGFGRDGYPSEPIYAPDSNTPDQGWILTVVYDGSRHESEVQVFAADGLDREPVCRLALPAVIPHGFHGTWRPRP